MWQPQRMSNLGRDSYIMQAERADHDGRRAEGWQPAGPRPVVAGLGSRQPPPQGAARLLATQMLPNSSLIK